MKKICLIGPVDKRILAYPLLKVLDLTGKTLVLTDDANFRRFSDDYGSEFSIGRIDIKVIHDITPNILSVLKVGDDYDYALIITTNTLIDDCDSVVYCHSLNKAMCTPEVLEVIEGVEHKDVTVTCSVVKDKGILKMVVDKAGLGYIWYCEETKLFCECKDAKLSKAVAYLFSDVLGISQDSIVKTLGRRE